MCVFLSKKCHSLVQGLVRSNCSSFDQLHPKTLSVESVCQPFAKIFDWQARKSKWLLVSENWTGAHSLLLLSAKVLHVSEHRAGVFVPWRTTTAHDCGQKVAEAHRQSATLLDLCLCVFSAPQSQNHSSRQAAFLKERETSVKQIKHKPTNHRRRLISAALKGEPGMSDDYPLWISQWRRAVCHHK